MFKLSAILISLIAAVLLPLQVASAQTPQITVPINTVIRDEAGTTHELAKENVEESLRGMECSVNAIAQNQSSVHPGNDLVVSSGDSKVTLEDVEREANVTTEASGKITLANEIVVTLLLGDDEVFSGGITVNLECEKPELIEVCREGKVITIKASERLDSDTDAPCPTPEEPTDEEPKVLPATTTLPKTGAGSIIAIFALTTAVLTSIGHSLVTRQRL